MAIMCLFHFFEGKETNLFSNMFFYINKIFQGGQSLSKVLLGERKGTALSAQQCHFWCIRSSGSNLNFATFKLPGHSQVT